VRPRSQDGQDRQDYAVEKIVNDPLSGLERAALALLSLEGLSRRSAYATGRQIGAGRQSPLGLDVMQDGGPSQGRG
jgi:hypothetical protein